MAKKKQAKKKQPAPLCGGCGARPGELHQHDCRHEQCLRCGGCLRECNHRVRLTSKLLQENERLPWTGMKPGEAECEEYGFLKEWGPEEVPGLTGDPIITPDYDRVFKECVWVPTQRRWIRKVSTQVGETKSKQ